MRLTVPSFEIRTPDSVITSWCRDIEEAGRTCYKSEDKITGDSADAFVRKIVRSGHHSVLEHASLSVRFIMDRGCCYDEETEVLTKNGWRYFRDVDFTDTFACLDDDDNLCWHRASDKQVYRYRGELLRFESTMIDLLVTPNHKMWVFDYDKRSDKTRTWKFLRADELANNRYKFRKNAGWNALDIPEVVVPPHPTKYHQYPSVTYKDGQIHDLFELLGLWVADGSYNRGYMSGSQTNIIITQTKHDGIHRINELCDRLDLAVRWNGNSAHIDNLRLYNFVVSLFGDKPKTFSAYVPRLIKEASASQIQSFLNGVVLGDGTVHKDNKHIAIYSSSKKFVDDLQELYLKVGLSASIRTDDRKDYCINGVSGQSLATKYIVSVHQPNSVVTLLNKKCAKNFGTPVEYDGYVYCVTVPHHRLYVRRNGKSCWCGNSHELVRHRLCAFSQESTRYCDYVDGHTEFIIPEWCDDLMAGEYVPGYFTTHPPFESDSYTWFHAMLAAESTYKSLRNTNGWAAQKARSVLPNSLKTEVVTTSNLREWRHILTLRTSRAAHPQIREVMIPLLADLKAICPPVFEDINVKPRKAIPVEGTGLL